MFASQQTVTATDPAEFIIPPSPQIPARLAPKWRLAGAPLVEMLAWAHSRRRTVTLLVVGEQTGSVHFAQGELIHAETSHRRGVRALLALLAAEVETIELSRPIPVQRTILAPLRRLLQARQVLDGEAALPEGEDLSEAIGDWSEE